MARWAPASRPRAPATAALRLLNPRRRTRPRTGVGRASRPSSAAVTGRGRRCPPRRVLPSSTVRPRPKPQLRRTPIRGCPRVPRTGTRARRSPRSRDFRRTPRRRNPLGQLPKRRPRKLRLLKPRQDRWHLRPSAHNGARRPVRPTPVEPPRRRWLRGPPPGRRHPAGPMPPTGRPPAVRPLVVEPLRGRTSRRPRPAHRAGRTRARRELLIGAPAAHPLNGLPPPAVVPPLGRCRPHP